MEKHILFKVGGIFLVLAGAIGVFFWVVSLLSGFGVETAIPSLTALQATTGMARVAQILVLAGSLIFSIGIILAGLVFMKIPEVVGNVGTGSEFEEKFNKLQELVLKILKHVNAKN